MIWTMVALIIIAVLWVDILFSSGAANYTFAEWLGDRLDDYNKED